MAMEISIRKWNHDDLVQIRRAWLDHCRNVTRSDMRFRSDADTAMKEWLAIRFRQPYSLGFVAETDGIVAGFVIGRIDDWESVPPVIEPRRVGIIDAVYVTEPLRRHGIGSQLIERAMQAMRDAHAIAVEAIYEASNDASAQAWRRAGFAPWMVHAYRML